MTEGNRQFFFPLLIGIAVGFLAGFLTALQWQPAETVLRDSPGSSIPPQQASMPAAGKKSLPEGHPPINYQKEIDKLLPALSTQPKNLALLSQIGNLYYDSGQYREAITYYEQALSLQPENFSIRTDLATCYYNMQEHERALKELDQVLAKKPDFSQALYNYGVIQYFGRKDKQATVSAWEKLLAVDPQYPSAGQVRENIQKLKAGQDLE